MSNTSSDCTDLRSTLSAIDDRNERAHHILDWGVMHDPDYADLVAAAASGPGEYSMQLSAMMIHANELCDLPASENGFPLPAQAGASAPTAVAERLQTNPFSQVEG